MRQDTKIVEWFRQEPVPTTLRLPVTVFGGPNLLTEFFSQVALASDGGQLSIAVPFVGERFASFLTDWAILNHAAIDLRVVTRTSGSALVIEDNLRQYPWRSFSLGLSRRLHAKIYVFVGQRGGGSCLVGSHNLSSAAAFRNYEAGVLFLADRSGEGGQILNSWSAQVTALLTDGTLLDTHPLANSEDGTTCQRSK